LLNDWGQAAKPRAGQGWQSKVFSDLISSLGAVFEEATGRPPRPGNRFMKFLEAVLAALPIGMRREVDDEALDALAQRVKRLFKKPQKVQSFGRI
jgi:hypothetical protein